MLPVEPDRGLFVYAALDVAFAFLYLYIGFALAPSRSPFVQAMVWILFVIMVGSGVCLALRQKWSRWVGLGAAVVVLLVCAFLITALLMSSAYLKGVYGGFGKGAATVCLLAAALSIEVFGLLPAFQIRFLLRPEVVARLERRPAKVSVAPAAKPEDKPSVAPAGEKDAAST
jgi:hypothetical protein